MENQKLNGQEPYQKRRPFTEKDWRRWVDYAKTHSVQKTSEHFGIVNSMIYGARKRLGRSVTKPRRAAYKPRRAAIRPGRRVGKGPPRAAYRGLYKARRAAPRGAAIDTLLYLEKARSRLLRALGAGLDPEPSLPVLGLIGLAIDSLRGGEE